MNRDLVIENLKGGLRNYGYVAISEPIAGHEDAWIEQVRDAVERVESAASSIRRDAGYRGRSKRLIRRLHQWLPEPVWGVEIDPLWK